MLKKIWLWITNAASKIKAALASGKDVANQIKAVADSKLLDAIVAATPTHLDDIALAAFRTALAKFITLMGWADIIIKNIEAVDPDAKAAMLTVINAKAAVLIADAKGVKLPIQKALASAPIVYNPELVD